MAITDNPLLEYESGQQFSDWEQMADVGDHKVFESGFFPWSGRAGFEAQVRPFGLATGGEIKVHANNNTVSVSALTAFMPGVQAANADGLAIVAGADVTINRATTQTHLINSIMLQADGVLAAVAGTEGSEFSETRDAAGGPPLIPVDAVELGQVRLSAQEAAVILPTEIYQVVGVHRERYDSPVWKEDPTTGEIEFASELPAIHTGNKTKQVGVKGYTPIFAESPRVSSFVPAEESNSVNSTEIYGGTLGSVSKSLGQASFTHYGKDGITDPLVKLKGEKLWFRFYQDKNKSPYSLTQGILGISRTFPAGQHVQINCTVSAEQATEDFDG